MHQEVLPGALRPAESTVETYGSTVESGGDGGHTIRMHDVGPPPRPLPVTEEDTPPATPASYRVPPRARHLPTAFVRSGSQEDWVPKRGSYHPTTATYVRGSHGQTTRRAPSEAADGRKTSRGGEDPGKGHPEQNWLDCLNDDFEAFGAMDGSTVDNRLTFGVNRVVWSLAAKVDAGVPWHKGVLQGVENFMTSWHKEEEEASRRRATKRNSEGSSTENTTRPGGGNNRGDNQGNKRSRMVQTDDIEDTTAVGESRREMTERVARYVPD